MTLSQFKFLAPQNPNKSTSIINGQSSGILNWNDLKYPQIYDMTRKGIENFWIPHTINMTNDIKDFQVKLNEKERITFRKVIALLSILDSVQPRILDELKGYITDPSIAAMLSTFSFQEVIHNMSYSYILASIESFDNQNEAFRMAQEKEIYERNNWVIDVYEEFKANPNIHTFAKALIASIVLEGINFYSGFAFFYNLARNKKMVTTSTMIGYINKDELIHTKALSDLIRMVLSENPEIDADGSFTKWTYEFIDKAVQLEIEWSMHVLKDITDIDKVEMKDYIQYLGNKRLRLIGLDELYKGKNENCMEWIKPFDPNNANEIKTDFFEQHSRNYTAVGEDNGFDDL